MTKTIKDKDRKIKELTEKLEKLKQKNRTLIKKAVFVLDLVGKAVAERKETEDRLNAMVASAPDGVIMVGKNNQILVINSTAKKMLNLKGRKFFITDLINILGDGKLDVQGKIEKSIKLKKLLTIDEVLVNDQFFKILISPVVSKEKKELLGSVILFHDITREKELEKMREDFTSMMVHELRSPLDAIKNLSELLQKEDVKQDEKTYDESLQMIYGSSSQMLEQVGDLLDVAKLESGKFEITTTMGDIVEVVKESIDYFKHLAKKKKIGLASKFASGLPKVEFDKTRISQALNNLISNALKFTDLGGRVIVQAFLHKKGNDLSREAKKAGLEWMSGADEKDIKTIPDSVAVAVTDTGCGIPENQIDKIFSKFQQLEVTRRTEKRGTGLGLTIVKGIIEAHGGAVGAESIEGEGSTFYFTLPIKIKSRVKQKDYENINR